MQFVASTTPDRSTAQVASVVVVALSRCNCVRVCVCVKNCPCLIFVVLVVVWESSVIFLPPARLWDFEEKPRRVVFYILIFFLSLRVASALAGPVSPM